jgi:hypothetical protein
LSLPKEELAILKLQNDTVRLQSTVEADALRRQVKQLQERMDHLILDNDRYRRALVAMGNNSSVGGRGTLLEPDSYVSSLASGQDGATLSVVK